MDHSSVQETKARVQQQFGTHAERYAVSEVHARGRSLDRMVELVSPQPADRVLDVATAVGHTALRLATRAQSVVGADLTPATLDTARRLARERRQENVAFAGADAEALPFPDAAFDVVTCRYAFHHMPNASQAVGEMARVCRAGGQAALVDNIAPDDEDTAAWVNRFETLRDPSHFQLWSLPAILAMFEAAGLAVDEQETLFKPMDFEDWTWRMDVPPDIKARLVEMLLDAPQPVQRWLNPHEVDGKLKFNLIECVVVGSRGGRGAR